MGGVKPPLVLCACKRTFYKRTNGPLTDFDVGTRCLFVRGYKRDVRYCGESLSALMSRGLLVQVERLHGGWRLEPLALPSWIWSVQHWIRALCPTRHVKSPLPKMQISDTVVSAESTFSFALLQPPGRERLETLAKLHPIVSPGLES